MLVIEVMELSYFHVADDVPKGFVPETAVVIDVLRATTTIASALHNGAEAVETFSDLDELRKRAAEWPESLRLLLGERGGKRINDFDLGTGGSGVREKLQIWTKIIAVHKPEEQQELYA